ncbi:MAG: hypothetical protein J0H24_20595, partial [Delftia acidovorans]|nr:hypothetical protein [Delftia acidovorans]
MPVDPQPLPHADTGAHGPGHAAIQGQVPPHPGPDLDPGTESPFAPGRQHPTKVAHQVDRIQVQVHSKGQAIGRQHRQSHPGLPRQPDGDPVGPVAELGCPQVLDRQAEPHVRGRSHHPEIEIDGEPRPAVEVGQPVECLPRCRRIDIP